MHQAIFKHDFSDSADVHTLNVTVVEASTNQVRVSTVFLQELALIPLFLLRSSW